MDLCNLFLAGARYRHSRGCLRCPDAVELIVVRLVHRQHRLELPIGNGGVSQVHSVRAFVGMVAFERKDVRILTTVDHVVRIRDNRWPGDWHKLPIRCSDGSGGGQSEAIGTEPGGSVQADPSRRTPPTEASRLKSEACPTASPPRKWPTMRMRFRSTLPCSG